jgi:hypothetical protein
MSVRRVTLTSLALALSTTLPLSTTLAIHAQVPLGARTSNIQQDENREFHYDYENCL